MMNGSMRVPGVAMNKELSDITESTIYQVPLTLENVFISNPPIGYEAEGINMFGIKNYRV